MAGSGKAYEGAGITFPPHPPETPVHEVERWRILEDHLSLRPSVVARIDNDTDNYIPAGAGGVDTPITWTSAVDTSHIWNGGTKFIVPRGLDGDWICTIELVVALSPPYPEYADTTIVSNVAVAINGFSGYNMISWSIWAPQHNGDAVGTLTGWASLVEGDEVEVFFVTDNYSDIDGSPQQPPWPGIGSYIRLRRLM